MAHKAIWRCKQACIMARGCTLKAWSEDPPRDVCLYSDDWIPCWERYQAKKGQRRLGVEYE